MDSVASWTRPRYPYRAAGAALRPHRRSRFFGRMEASLRSRPLLPRDSVLAEQAVPVTGGVIGSSDETHR